MNNAALITSMLLASAVQTQKLAAVLNTSKAEGRDVTDAEFAAAVADYRASDSSLAAAIARAEASGQHG